MSVSIYEGPLYSNKNDKMDEISRKAYVVFCKQKDRCYNKNSPRFPFYGAKGIRVLYSPREFIPWFVDRYSKFKGKKASVGRIDHSKGYYLDNIEMIELSDNVKERNTRCGNPMEFKRLEISKMNDPFCSTYSLKDAALVMGCHISYVSKMINLKKFHYQEFTFRVLP